MNFTDNFLKIENQQKVVGKKGFRVNFVERMPEDCLQILGEFFIFTCNRRLFINLITYHEMPSSQFCQHILQAWSVLQNFRLSTSQ